VSLLSLSVRGWTLYESHAVLNAIEKAVSELVEQLPKQLNHFDDAILSLA